MIDVWYNFDAGFMFLDAPGNKNILSKTPFNQALLAIVQKCYAYGTCTHDQKCNQRACKIVEVMSMK
jgi:hypothetical protein